MENASAKLLQYVLSGYHIKHCTRSKHKRVIKLRAPVFSIFQPTLTLTEQQYEKAMRTLIGWLIKSQSEGNLVEICTSHFGHEWVELRSPSGKLRSKMALSVRAINSLKAGLMDNSTALLAQADPTDTDAAPEQGASFPRQLPRKPAIPADAIPEQWRRAHQR